MTKMLVEIEFEPFDVDLEEVLNDYETSTVQDEIMAVLQTHVPLAVESDGYEARKVKVTFRDATD